MRELRIGCAGWSIPRHLASRFPEGGSHLERYARVFPAVEIDSSFYREHKPETYARWARSVPAGFRFAVKVPREITHFRKLSRPQGPLKSFLTGVGELGRNLAPLLVQLPPSLAFNKTRAGSFFRLLRSLHRGPVVCEPRHLSWLDPEADALLRRHHVGRVAADPVRDPRAAELGGWPQLVYFRLHGRPKVYYSAYSEEYLVSLADRLRALPAGARLWCIFDNTAAGAAPVNALRLLELTR